MRLPSYEDFGGFDALKTSRYIGDLIREIEEKEGIALAYHTDFAELVERSKELQGKRPTLGLLNPRIDQVDERHGFWISGSVDGRLVHVQALRKIDLEQMPLSEHFSRYRHLYQPPDMPEIDAERSEFHHSPRAYGLKGRVVYHGEIFNDRSIGGRELAKVLPPLAAAKAFEKFDPVALFGFVDEGIADRGFTSQYGYYDTDPNAIIWRGQNGEEVLRWFIAVSERHHVLSRINVEGIRARRRREQRSQPTPGSQVQAVS